jgi:transposase
MISIAPGTKVYLACRPVSMRYGFDGLAAQVKQVLDADPFSGHVFIFRAKRAVSGVADPRLCGAEAGFRVTARVG